MEDEAAAATAGHMGVTCVPARIHAYNTSCIEASLYCQTAVAQESHALAAAGNVRICDPNCVVTMLSRTPAPQGEKEKKELIKTPQQFGNFKCHSGVCKTDVFAEEILLACLSR